MPCPARSTVPGVRRWRPRRCRRWPCRRRLRPLVPMCRQSPRLCRAMRRLPMRFCRSNLVNSFCFLSVGESGLISQGRLKNHFQTACRCFKDKASNRLKQNASRTVRCRTRREFCRSPNASRPDAWPESDNPPWQSVSRQGFSPAHPAPPLRQK